uniref:NAD-dependent succinate-semialdehyde dehydrogenase n=1 Tax=uncultured Maritalea sp. TaxID=757249 RepID=UPI0026280C63
DTGKMFKETAWQATYIAEYFHFYAGAADKIHGDTLPIDKPDMFVFTDREPIGVVAAVIPWNSQMFLTAVKVGPALAAGNTIVLKASEHASAPLLEFGKLIAKAGIPDGVVNIITGGAEPCGRVLTSHPSVAKVAFTGGPTAARHIVRNAAENFAEVSLELGGKSPFIVFDDADLDAAVEGALNSKFRNSGQTCVCANRLYVQAGIYDAFATAFAKRVESLKVGDAFEEGVTQGPLINANALKKVEELVADARDKGAIAATGGKPHELGGLYYQPTVLRDVPLNARVLKEEIFGPVAPLIKFETEEEVINLANDSEFGLAGYFFARDIGRVWRVAEALECGIVGVNEGITSAVEAPFGGVKQSGLGREGSHYGLDDYMEVKYVLMGGLGK